MMRLVLACLLCLPAGAWAQQDVLTLEGRGVQVYRCGDDAVWSVATPEAELFLNGAKVGTHGAGPTWTYQDGSSVQGSLVTAAPVQGAVPWLLLRAQNPAGTGKLNRVAYIVRSETRGGLPNAGACTPGSMSRVSYTAMYTFYGPLEAAAK